MSLNNDEDDLSQSAASSLLFHRDDVEITAECDPNNLGQSQARERLKSLDHEFVAGCESDGGSGGLLHEEKPPGSPSNGLPQAIALSDVCRSDAARPSLFKTSRLDAVAIGYVVANSSANPPLNLKPTDLPLQFLLGPKDATKERRKIPLDEVSQKEAIERVMAWFVQQETHELTGDVHLREDYRQMQICLALARDGNPIPFVQSSYEMYGTHPDKVWKKRQQDRHAKLGVEYGQWFDAAGKLLPDVGVPKKPPVNEAVEESTRERLAAVLKFRPLPLPPAGDKESA